MKTTFKVDDEIGKHDTRLVCNVLWLHYDFIKEIGTIAFPEDNCCDMGGVIKIFTSIDEDCKDIQTYAGDKKDTRYLRRHGDWKAL
jgi:hypothetical protein